VNNLRQRFILRGNVNLFSISYGSALFNFVGCTLCHTRSMKTASTGTTALSEKTSTSSAQKQHILNFLRSL